MQHDPTPEPDRPDPESQAIHAELEDALRAHRRSRIVDWRTERLTFREMEPLAKAEFPTLAGNDYTGLWREYQKVMNGLEPVATAEVMRREDLTSIEQILRAWMPLATGLPVLDVYLKEGEGEQGVDRFVKVLAQSAKAAEVVLKAMARRAKLAGLDHVGMDESGRFDPATADVEQVIARVVELHSLYGNHVARNAVEDRSA